MRCIPLLTLATVALTTACASAGVDPAALSLTAREALPEARSQARGWDADAQLRFVEGASVDNSGHVRPDAGYWRFVFDAAGKSQQLAVTIRPTSVETTERTPQSPPGFVIGARALGNDWIDSSEAIAAGPAFAADTRVPMLLVPTAPTRWYISFADDRVVIDADSGTRIE